MKQGHEMEKRKRIKVRKKEEEKRKVFLCFSQNSTLSVDLLLLLLRSRREFFLTFSGTTKVWPCKTGQFEGSGVADGVRDIKPGVGGTSNELWKRSNWCCPR